MRPTWRRSSTSSQSVPVGVRRADATSTIRSTWPRRLMMCCANAVPRSKRSVTLATRQPSCSSPTRFATGTRTSSRNSSQKWSSPSMVRIGRTVMPSLCIGRISQRDPLVLGGVGVGADEQLAVVGDLRRGCTRSSGR